MSALSSGSVGLSGQVAVQFFRFGDLQIPTHDLNNSVGDRYSDARSNRRRNGDCITNLGRG